MRKFFKTVAVVTVFSVSEKFLGFLYRIYLSRTVGAEGIGIYQVAVSVFGLLLTACCSGTPVTVSRLMTKYKAEGKKKNVNKVITAALMITIITAIPLFVFFMIPSGILDFIFADERCVTAFMIIMPGLIFTSVYSVMRGVFWGNKDFLPYSIIELLEELVMICAGIILIGAGTDAYSGANKCSLAVLISFIFSFTASIIVFFVRKNRLANPRGEIKPLIKSAFPITCMRTATTLAISLVSIILPMRLISAGLTHSQAMSAFGSAVGQAIPILFIPTTLIGSFTIVLIPEIAENFYSKRYFYLKRDVEKSFKFTVLIACLFIPVFAVCGEEIGVTIFNSTECGEYLSRSAFLVLFICLSNVSTSILNSIGLEHKTLIYFIIGGICMGCCIWFLPKYVGVYALLIGFTFVYGLSTVLNIRLIDKHCPEKANYKRFLFGAIMCIIPSYVFGMLLEHLFINLLGTFLTLIICGISIVLFTLGLYFVFNMTDFALIKQKITQLLFKKKLRDGKVKSVN